MTKRGDRVYTPEWVARDMLEHFRPSGRILEPCRGDIGREVLIEARQFQVQRLEGDS